MRNRNAIIMSIIFLLVLVILFFSLIKEKKYPDIILITIDSLRADHISCYGYPRTTSPNIDKLAHEGVLFKNCFSVSVSTPCVFPSLLTGKYLVNYSPGKDHFLNVLDKKFKTLPEYLKRIGYFTGAFLENPNLMIGSGFEQGIETYKPSCGYASEITAKATDFLNKNRNKKPIFLWVHYIDTHTPYNAPEKFIELFKYDLLYKENTIKLKLDPNFEREPFQTFGFIPGNAFKKDHYDLNYYIANYDAAISYVDYNIGKLLENVSDNALIILSADHGESLGEENLYFSHGNENLIDAEVRIPLIIKDKNYFKGGKVINTAVSTVDIFPTVLRRIAPKHSLLFESRLDGIDLKELLISGKTKRVYIYSYFGGNARIIEVNKNISFSIKDNNLRYNKNELDLDSSSMMSQLKKELKAWLKDHPVPSSLKLQRNKDTEQEVIDKLKSLGYLN